MSRPATHIITIAALLVLLATRLLAAAAAPTAADRVGPDGIVYPDFSRVGIPGGIPEVAVVVRAADFGAVPDDEGEDGAAIQAAVDAAAEQGGGAVLLEGGTYLIDHGIVLARDGVVLRGAGRDQTRLMARFADSEGGTVITIQAEKVQRRYDAHPDRAIRRGDTTLHLPADHAERVRVGDVVTLTATPPADVIATLSPKLQSLATDGSYGSIAAWQYLEVTAIDGQEITVAQPLRLDVALDQKPKLMHVPALVSGCGIEDLGIAQTVDTQAIHGIRMGSARGCWLRGVAVHRIGNWPFSMGRCWQFELRDCVMDESLSRGGAKAYIGFGFACDGLIEACRFTRLRHLSVSMASNGLVFRDCELVNIDINFHMHWPYEVLFENCRVDSGLGPDAAPGEESRGSYRIGIYTPRLDGDIHNPAGPRLTFYHNDIVSPFDGLMLGGGATRHTIVAYNRFDVAESFAAVIKRGSEHSVVRANRFVLRSPHQRKRWMMRESYGHEHPDTLRGAVLFPHGAPEGIDISGNVFQVPRPLPIFVGGEPEQAGDNRLVAALDAPEEPEHVPLAGEWRLAATGLVAPAAGMHERRIDPGPDAAVRALLALDATAAIDAAWPGLALPRMLDSAAADLKQRDGEVVLCRAFDLPAGLLGRELTLSLGPIDDFDQTWINGVRIGATIGDDAWRTPRRYTVPADLLRAEGNLVVVRVWDQFGGGGFAGQHSELWIGVPPREVEIEAGPLPEAPVPSLYRWQVETAAQEP